MIENVATLKWMQNLQHLLNEKEGFFQAQQQTDLLDISIFFSICFLKEGI
ncbi:hypothetical protein ACS0PU_011930 [Formica fusca]